MNFSPTHWVIFAVIVAVILYAVVHVLKAVKGLNISTTERICKSCGTVVRGARVGGCSACGSKDLVPTDSPVGRQLVESSKKAP
jgi:hypothetical protein